MPTMTPLLMSLAAFACIFGGTFLGIFVRRKLPDQHLTGDTKDIVRQGTGLIATLASLVLGSSDRLRQRQIRGRNQPLKQLTAHVILLDNSLALFGPDADALRERCCGATSTLPPIEYGARAGRNSEGRNRFRRTLRRLRFLARF